MSAPQTPQEAFGILMKELAASASTQINAKTAADPNEPNVSLREAVGAIFWQERALVDLANRPVGPRKADRQLGHLLSLRVEVLQNQAMLAWIMAKLGGDPVSMLNQVAQGVAPS